MDDRTITVSISDDEQAFIDSEVASGRYASGSEVVRAALAALEAVGTATHRPADYDHRDVAEVRSEPASLTGYLSENAQHLKLVLEASKASGESARTVPQIIEAVKSKLRANGSI